LLKHRNKINMSKNFRFRSEEAEDEARSKTVSGHVTVGFRNQ